MVGIVRTAACYPTVGEPVDPVDQPADKRRTGGGCATKARRGRSRWSSSDVERASLLDRTRLDELGELVVEGAHRVVGQRLVEPDHQRVAHVPRAVVDAVELEHVPGGVLGVLGEVVQPGVLLADPAPAQQLAPDEAVEALPVARGLARALERARWGPCELLPVWMSVSTLEGLVHGAEAAREAARPRPHWLRNMSLRVKKYSKVDELLVAIDHVVGGGLEGQADGDAEARRRGPGPT
jgi:hypothetical protein